MTYPHRATQSRAWRRHTAWDIAADGEREQVIAERPQLRDIFDEIDRIIRERGNLIKRIPLNEPPQEDQEGQIDQLGDSQTSSRDGETERAAQIEHAPTLKGERADGAGPSGHLGFPPALSTALRRARRFGRQHGGFARANSTV